MTKGLQSYLRFRNRFYGVELTQVKGEYKYFGIYIKNTLNGLDIEASFEAANIDMLKTYIPKGKPIVLVINTDSILTKKIKAKTNEPLRLVNLAFPNIKVEDFYYETTKQGANHFVSVCRKSYVNELLNKYTSKNITIIDFTLGSLICSSIVGVVEYDNIQTTKSLISIKDSQIAEISSQDVWHSVTYSINGIEIKNNQILGFAAVLNLVLQNQHIQSSFTDTKTELNKTFAQKHFASQFLKTSLSSLFIVLLFNFFSFNHYYNEVNTLRETAQILESSKVKMISLNEKVQKTEKMVDDVLKSSASKSSFYVNVIISNLSESILLKELNYQPLLKKIKEDKAIENHKNKILISGQSNNSIEFSRWISQLENYKWVQSVNILSFEDTSKSSSSFTIKLNMQDDTKD